MNYTSYFFHRNWKRSTHSHLDHKTHLPKKNKTHHCQSFNFLTKKSGWTPFWVPLVFFSRKTNHQNSFMVNRPAPQTTAQASPSYDRAWCTHRGFLDLYLTSGCFWAGSKNFTEGSNKKQVKQQVPTTAFFLKSKFWLLGREGSKDSIRLISSQKGLHEILWLYYSSKKLGIFITYLAMVMSLVNTVKPKKTTDVDKPHPKNNRATHD